MPLAVRQTLDRDDAVDWYLRNRARSRALFNLLSPDAYYTRPISLRNPVVFYEGHLPAFSVIALIKRGLGRPGVDERLETLFARGIDPEDERAASTASSASAAWPSREEVQAYARRADAAILDVLRTQPLEVIGRPAMRRLEAVYAALEHEQMHQETLMYMWHELPYELKRAPDDYRPVTGGDPPAPNTVHIPPGRATLGADPLRDPFWWDNEYPPQQVDVPGFDIDVFPVTNRDFLQFVEAGHEPPHFWTCLDGVWSWRGMFQELPLPMAWPAWVTWRQADAYARWKGRRLPTEAEYHRAAFGHPLGTGENPPTAQRRGASSTLRASIPRRWGPARAARARGAFTISSATDGNGPPPCSPGSPVSSRCRRIPSIPPTSSTASTTS
jgi:formylglycine-generating enzyme required for sulfatase activity